MLTRDRNWEVMVAKGKQRKNHLYTVQALSKSLYNQSEKCKSFYPKGLQ